MRQTEWNYNGDSCPMSFTADALFKIYDKYGAGNLLEVSKIADDTEEGYLNLCWVAALLCSEAELQRRYMGEDPRPMLSAEELQLMLAPCDIPALRSAVTEAIRQGFRTEAAPEETEVNLVLREREEAKKAKTPASSGSGFWRRLFASSD